MADELNVRIGALEEIAARLGRTADRLDATSEVAPPVPDAGQATAAIGGLLSRLTESAGGLADGLRTAQDGVNQSRATYLSQDAAVQQTVEGIL